MSLSLAIFCPSCGGHEEAVTSWSDTLLRPWPITVDAETQGDNAGFLTKCDKFWRTCDADFIGYLHSDLYTLEHGWDQRVIEQFADPQVGVVGFVGATQLGMDDIYRVPYDFRQLARANVVGNMTDMEAHGERITESRSVAVLDSMAVMVRRSLLARLGGWPVARYPNSSHCSDLWICCSSHRLGYRVRVTPVACTHKSGGKGQAGCEWLDARGGDDKFHKDAHRVLYNDMRDVLPIRIR